MKNQSGTIKTNLELYRVVKGGSGGYRRLPGGSAHFSWHTNRHCIIIYISSPSSRLPLSSSSSLLLSSSSISNHDDQGWTKYWHDWIGGTRAEPFEHLRLPRMQLSLQAWSIIYVQHTNFVKKEREIQGREINPPFDLMQQSRYHSWFDQ